VLLMAESFSDLLNRYKYLYLVTRRDRTLVRDVDRMRRQLALRDEALKAALADIEYLQVEHRAELQALQSLEGVQRQTLTSLRSRESTAQRRAAELEQDENRLVAVLANLDRRRLDAERVEARRTPAPAVTGGAAPARPSAAERGPEAPTLTTADAGALNWPVAGRLVYRFGRETQPNGTTIRWNGVGIAAAAGTPVRVVEAGTVVMASSFEGYGPTVVVSHGGGYYSLYLYLRDLNVREGATVTKGQVIGTVGGESTPEGAHVEFQIRAAGGRAVDPLTWLRRGAAGG
jgi:septal ring factor EnvC (AmiA/AmiB activator)